MSSLFAIQELLASQQTIQNYAYRCCPRYFYCCFYVCAVQAISCDTDAGTMRV